MTTVMTAVMVGEVVMTLEVLEVLVVLVVVIKETNTVADDIKHSE